MDERSFLLNRETALGYLSSLQHVFVFDGFANWAPEVRGRWGRMRGGRDVGVGCGIVCGGCGGGGGGAARPAWAAVTAARPTPQPPY